MQLTNIRIENYKGLHEAECKLSDFVCVIGENNAGKSSLLQAILLFITGTRLTKDAYYDSTRDILITVSILGITDAVLDNLNDDHRSKLATFVDNQSITLARRYSTDGTSKLRVVTQIPRERKYRPERLDETFSGKKGKEISEVLKMFYPEISNDEKFEAVSSQKAAKELIGEYVKKLPAEDFVLEDIQLPTGIDNSIRAILPEPVYIPAVKDLIDDLKTKEGASFGKLLNILLDVIEEDLAEAAETFENLRKKLNRVQMEDGSILDDRMDRVKRIEQTIQDNLKETFRDVQIELEIPPPEIKTVLSNATVLADDGVRGSVDNKGDGFKRAITFSILRTYVQLSQDKDWRKDSEDHKPVRDKFLFLFEEPELYLHPRAQNILFEALSLISDRHQTIVTTHSPLFFSADETTTFAKIYKKQTGMKPIGICKHIDLSGLNEKDRFQLISFESSNQAFFSRKIVLVEGDSELIVLPHIARILNQHWDFKSTSTSLIKISGKGSFLRYRQFFELFDVEVALVADLDAMLEGFDKLNPSCEAKRIRAELITLIDTVIDNENLKDEPSPRLIKEEMQRERFGIKLEELKQARAKDDNARMVDLLDQLFVFEKTKPRLEVLKDHSRKEVTSKKRELLAELRHSGVYLLEKGAIEAYYPIRVIGGDKPTKAQSFCSCVTTPEELNDLCETIQENGKSVSEFNVIMNGIFAL